MQELDDEYCEVLEAVRIDCHRHRLNAGLGRQLDLDTNKVSMNFQKTAFWETSGYMDFH